jgi:plasmid replication initiation protein
MGKIKAADGERLPARSKVSKDADEHWVVMSNALTRAGHGLTLSEKRIVVLGISKLDRRNSPPAGMSPVAKVTAAEYAQQFGVDLRTAYEALQDGARALYNRSISFYQAAPKRNGKAGKVTHTMRWVGRATYHDGEGWVELCFWHELVPHLIGLQKWFTQYQLHQVRALRSAYSWRLLELLERFREKKGEGWAEYDIEDFAIAMDATPKQREDFAKLRTKIIEPAVRELTEKDGWLIEWEPIKAGRKVKAVRFKFMRKNLADQYLLEI